MDIEHLRYPVGKWKKPAGYDSVLIADQVAIIANFPEKLKLKLAVFSEEQLETPYRPDGWTVKQVVHHCADSHMNAFVRFKLALTEEKPTIKPYTESLWAELPDAKLLQPQISLQLLEALHIRWAILLTSLKKEDWERGFIHPEHNGELKLYEVVSLYAWHCDHHFAHVSLVG